MAPDLANPLVRAELALQLLARAPEAFGGVVLRARVGPVRSWLEGRVTALFGDLPRLHPGMDEEALHDGLDLMATLAAGRTVARVGLLSGPGPWQVTMAERCPPSLSAPLAQALDRGGAVILWDEGASDDEGVPAILSERCAFFIDCNGVRAEAATLALRPGATASVGPEAVRALTEGAAAFGIDSLRAPLFAARAAGHYGALFQHETVTADDLAAAASLTLAHRATTLPPPPAEEPEAEAEAQSQSKGTEPKEVVEEAVKALLPDDILSHLALAATRSGRGQGAGGLRTGNRRGRPLPSRPGRPSSGRRIDLVATLHAAAPWQRLRPGTGLRILPGDLRIKQAQLQSDRVLIFAVDASGSAAYTRMAEAKGAVEQLLAQAYSRRDHVALLTFRGTEAEVLLPPTRSLVQAKRRLAALPGGGGTPLANGFLTAGTLAREATAKGFSPAVLALTDGKANIALDGTANRREAAEDARKTGLALRRAGVPVLIVDCGRRSEPALRHLAQTMDAPYTFLPHARIDGLASAIDQVLEP